MEQSTAGKFDVANVPLAARVPFLAEDVLLVGGAKATVEATPILEGVASRQLMSTSPR
jgi:hypothetical protein